MSRRLTALERRDASTEEQEALAFWKGDKRRVGFARAHRGMAFRVNDSRGQDMNGWPDVVMVLPKRDSTSFTLDWRTVGIGIEIKVADDPVSPRQRDVLDWLARSGWLTLIVRYGRPRAGEVSQDEAVAIIEEALR